MGLHLVLEGGGGMNNIIAVVLAVTLFLATPLAEMQGKEIPPVVITRSTEEEE
jgi:hypothetical protein